MQEDDEDRARHVHVQERLEETKAEARPQRLEHQVEVNAFTFGVAVLRAVVEEKRTLPWAYLVWNLRRNSTRQRYWGLLGQLLQEYPASLRDRLRLVWPKL